VALTAVAGVLPGSQGLNALTWLGTVATIAAFLVALGIYRLQGHEQDEAHAKLLDRLDAQDELIREFAAAAVQQPTSADEDEALTAAQRAAIKDKYGGDSIAAAWKIGAGRGNRPRLVQLSDGRIVSVYSGGRAGGTYVHEVEPHRVGS
jgi:hypothetical protein